MNNDNDLQHQNAQLRLQVQILQDRLSAILETSHRLRAQITSASGCAKLLLNRSADIEPELLCEGASRIDKSCKESIQLLDSVMQTACEP